MGRSWQSGLGNCYVSTIVRLNAGDPAAAGLAFVAAVAVRAALADFAPQPDFALKWPNDILVGGAKLCGMLLERGDDAVILGIGVNLVHHPEGLDRPVTSLAALGIMAPEPQAFTEHLAGIFADRLQKWRLGGLSGILAEWRQYAHEAGTMLTANLPDGTRVDGAYIDIADDGALKLRLADGRIHAIHAGDVFLV